ncbi:hypothetical protein PHMEG_00021447 [Phytophthora megakarya]|uniref:Uncharacterized protein n=1 Tax=Phytophthora megakarya TaxID=4795 RepID=A0A225VLV3_9STRA|nr:hypothetical protein PHMEG_00021447 [Phytophthora megakarya]
MAILTAQEKSLIFLAKAQQRLDPLGRTVHERVAECLAVSENSIARVVAAYNKHGDDAFMAPPAKRGRPRSEVEPYREFIMEVINDRNLLRQPTSSKTYVPS